MTIPAVLISSDSEEWPTPLDLFGQLEHEFGPFDLDPAATEENAKARRYFTRADNGLVQRWDAGRIYLNPPYGRTIGKWVQKAFEASQSGSTVVCLLPARTDSIWFHEYAVKGEVRFIRGRLKFNAGTGWNAPFASCVVIFRPRELEAVQPSFDERA